MPPKTVRRRAPRATARKSLLSSATQSLFPLPQPSSQSGAALNSEIEKTTTETTPDPPSALESPNREKTSIKPMPPPEITETVNATTETLPEPSSAPEIPESVKTITEIAPNPSPPPDNSEDPAGEGSNDVATESETKEETPRVAVLETLVHPEEPKIEASVDNGKENEDNVGDNGGKEKAKKMVKKTVKVVKKVIKKVPKRVPKGENSSNTNSISNADENKEEKKGDGELMEVDDDESSKAASTGGELNGDGSGSNADEKNVEEKKGDELKMEVDDNEGSKAASTGGELDGDGLGSSSNTDEKNDSLGHKDEEGKKGDELIMEVDDNVGGVDVKAGGKEEEGEGKLFRGELEAMERRKRRRTEVFIGGLDREAKEEDVRKVFEKIGEIVDVRVVMNAKTGKNKGFAFMRFASAVDAKTAVDKYSKVEICGKQCHVTPVEGNDTIFLGNIDKKWKIDDVLKLLQEIGIENIDNINVMVDPNQSECNRGFAFVEFETCKGAEVAYKKLQNKNALGKNQNIKVAWAEPLKELDEEEMRKVKTVFAEFIPSSWDEEKVRDTFKKYGEIEDVVLARNLRTIKRKDFAFVSYKTRDSAVECIESFSCELTDEDGIKVNVKVSLAKPMQKNKKPKPVEKPVAKENPKKKPKTSHYNPRASELRNRAHPIVSHYGTPIAQRSSTNAELVHLLREQASWRPSHANMSNSPLDIHYSNPVPGRKRPLSMLEADPLYPGSSRYPYSRMDASFPVASSSHNVVNPSGLTNSMAHHQQHSGYLSGSLYGARTYPSNIEIRGKAHGSNNVYRRY